MKMRMREGLGVSPSMSNAYLPLICKGCRGLYLQIIVFLFDRSSIPSPDSSVLTFPNEELIM